MPKCWYNVQKVCLRMNTFLICFQMYCKHRLQIHDLHSVFTARTLPRASRLQRAHGALENPTALSQRPHSENAKPRRCFLHVQKDTPAMRSKRLHRAHTALKQRCWRLHDWHLGDLHSSDAVGTL